MTIDLKLALRSVDDRPLFATSGTRIVSSPGPRIHGGRPSEQSVISTQRREPRRDWQ